MLRNAVSSLRGWFRAQEVLRQSRIVAEIDLRDYWLRMAASLALAATCWFGGYPTLAVIFISANVAFNILLSRCAVTILKLGDEAPPWALMFHYGLSFAMMLNYVLTPFPLAFADHWLVAAFALTWLTGILIHAAMNVSATKLFFWIQMLPAMMAYAAYSLLLIQRPDNGADAILSLTFLVGCASLLYSATELLLRRRNILIELASARAEVEARLKETQRLARIDALTGLPNRCAFEELLSQRLEAEGAERLAVGLADLNGFKAVNDRYGHDAGDLVLRHVGRNIQQVLGKDGVIARLGGDEFALILFDCPGREAAARLGARIIEASSRSTTFEGAAVSVGASLGVVLTANETKRGVSSLLRAADLSMYAAKSNANHVVIYDPAKIAIEQCFDRQIAIESALLRGDVSPKFAPRIELASGQPAGLEVVSNWRDAETGALQPLRGGETELPPQLRCALNKAVGRQVLQHLQQIAPCSQICSPVSLDVSMACLSSEEELAELGEMIAAFRGCGAELMIEIAEEELLTRSVLFRLSDIREMGALIGVKNFGVGHAGYRHLETAPLDQLKLHPKLIRAIDRDDRAKRVVDGLLATCQGLGVQMVADGIETEGQKAALLSLGLPFGQGPLFGRPASLDEIMAQRSSAKGAVA